MKIKRIRPAVVVVVASAATVVGVVSPDAAVVAVVAAAALLPPVVNGVVAAPPAGPPKVPGVYGLLPRFSTRKPKRLPFILPSPAPGAWKHIPQERRQAVHMYLGFLRHSPYFCQKLQLISLSWQPEINEWESEWVISSTLKSKSTYCHRVGLWSKGWAEQHWG